MFAAPPPLTAAQAESAARALAEVAARELSQALGVPCTAIPVSPPADDGDVTCAQADGTPEGAVAGMEALWRRADRFKQPRGGEARRRVRVVGAILGYLRASEVDWAQLATVPPDWSERASDARVHAIEDCKQLHDAQLAELFERIGDAL